MIAFQTIINSISYLITTLFQTISNSISYLIMIPFPTIIILSVIWLWFYFKRLLILSVIWLWFHFEQLLSLSVIWLRLLIVSVMWFVSNIRFCNSYYCFNIHSLFFGAFQTIINSISSLTTIINSISYLIIFLTCDCNSYYRFGIHRICFSSVTIASTLTINYLTSFLTLNHWIHCWSKDSLLVLIYGRLPYDDYTSN